MALFFVSGWGLGHATRVHALIDELVQLKPKISITVFAWGGAAKYFTEATSYPVVTLKSYLRPEDSLYEMNFGRTLMTAIRWLSIWIQNLKTVYLFRTSQPSGRSAIAVFDSDFHFPALFATPISRVALSQTAFVLENWKLVLHGRNKVSWLLKLLIWEGVEHVVHRVAFHHIICPRLDGRSFRSGRTFHTGLFVRQNFRKKFSQVTNPEAVGWLGSASVASNSIRQLMAQLKIPSASRAREGDFDLAMNSEGQPAIDFFDRIVSQCGYSTLSELIVRQKPSFLIPAPGSPEQKINSLFCHRHYSFLRTLDSQATEAFEILHWRNSADSSRVEPIIKAESGEAASAALLCKMFDKLDEAQQTVH